MAPSLLSSSIPLRVLVVGRDQLARAGLAALLEQQPGLLVAGQSADNEELEPSIIAFVPDVIVWDLGWNAPASLERLAEVSDGVPPILGLLSDDSHAADARAAGATGLGARDAGADVLVASLAAVAQGLVVLDPAFISAFPAARSSPEGEAPELTQRELETLRLIAEGLPNKAIAGRMGISDSTVKFHVNSLLGKLGAQSRTEAVTRATRLGLILL